MNALKRAGYLNSSFNGLLLGLVCGSGQGGRPNCGAHFRASCSRVPLEASAGSYCLGPRHSGQQSLALSKAARSYQANAQANVGPVHRGPLAEGIWFHSFPYVESTWWTQNGLLSAICYVQFQESSRKGAAVSFAVPRSMLNGRTVRHTRLAASLSPVQVYAVCSFDHIEPDTTHQKVHPTPDARGDVCAPACDRRLSAWLSLRSAIVRASSQPKRPEL